MQRIIAILGLLAVLLGALEHEDLLFQNTSQAPDSLVAPDVLYLSADWQETLAESGTEGTFRSETNRLALSPKSEMRPAFNPLRVAACLPSARAITRDQRAYSRSRPGGVMALRL